MQPVLSSTQDWRRPFWLALLVASSIAFSFAFACAVPFAALAAATALTLPQRDAVILMAGAWLANQLTGFLFLGYPWDAATLAWGAALGAVALLSLCATRITATRLQSMTPITCCTLAYLAAFAAYEASCYAFALALGGSEDFTLAIQSRIFAINTCALLALFALNRAGSSLRLAPVYNNLARSAT